MRKVFLSSMLFLVLVSHVLSADAYAEERRTINEMIMVMESYMTAIEGSDAVETMTHAINDLAVKLEALIPKMKELSEKNPDWDDSPPADLKETMDRYVEISKKFFMESLQKAVEYANKYQDNKTLQEAFGKLNLVMSQMGGRASE